MMLYKFGALQGEQWGPYYYGDVWDTEETTGPSRLVIAPATGQIDTLIALSRLLPEPFFVLYVLLIPRSPRNPGRYQSRIPCSRAELEEFLYKYQEFFESDSRHHVWVRSTPAAATLVYDHHNVIYAYGPLDEYRETLRQRGLSQGPVLYPTPHQHKYNKEFDDQETGLMNYWDWLYFPLTKKERQ